MAEQEIPADAFIVYYVCDACGNGLMENAKLDISNGLCSFIHTCSSCDTTMKFPEKYPRTLFKPRITET